MEQKNLRSCRQSNIRGTKDDPTVRLNISMPKSAHKTLLGLAKAQRVSLSAFLYQAALSPDSELVHKYRLLEQKFTSLEVEFFKTMIELLGPLTFNELIDLLQKHKQKQTDGN